MITFHDAKDGNLTCSKENLHLHSAYSPIQEAKRFVENLDCPFIPKIVLIMEPCISYCADFLREKFPGCTLSAIRFLDDFKKFDSKFDKTFYIDDLLENPDAILNFFGEEKLCACFVASWTPSEKAFLDECGKTAKLLKAQILKARDILGTRSFFSSRWILNAVSFAKNIKQLQENERTYKISSEKPEKSNSPIVIAASGPSLENLLPSLKKLKNENGKDFFLIAVSSAFSALKKNGIAPDVLLTTDGGFYAKKHIDSPEANGKNESETAIAISSEGAFPKQMFQKCKIIPLSYFDGTEMKILQEAGIHATKIERNGTVSGTALKLAKSLTDGEIFLLGLDLAPQKGFQHTQPNALDIENDARQKRLAPKETRLTRSRLSSTETLSIYRQWFSSLKAEDVKNVYRIKENFDFSNKLGNIEEKNADFMENAIKKYSEKTDKNRLFIEKISKTVYKNTKTNNLNAIFSSTVYKNITKNHLNNNFYSGVEKIIQNDLVDIFPLETVLLEREKDAGKRSEFELKLKEKEDSLVRKIRTV